jgi:aspartyl-tRNA(Asn)/glutamyl-tRNA(Gln) amidotransferase subunit A
MALAGDLLFAGVAELSERMRTRELSPVALAGAYLDRIERLQPRLQVFVTVTRERALADARTAEAEIGRGRWRGSLHGMPCGLVDLVDTAGIRTTFGARPYADRVPEKDAVVAQRLREAGAVLLGKLSTIELAGGLGYRTGAAALNGPCRNPWDPTRWAGGPSSGPAAGVGAGLVAFAIGSETWGSITCPAAFCGVTGLRPTYGVIPRRGTMPLAYTLDKLGPVARSARDCALVLGAVAGPDPQDPASAPLPRGLGRIRPEMPRGLRIAALAFPDHPRTAPGAREAYAAARAVFEGGGALVEDAHLPDLPWREVISLLLEAEAANAFEDLIRSGRTRELADPSHQTRAPDDYLPRASSADYVRAARLRAEGQRALARFLERFDLVLAPNLPLAPPGAEEVLDSTSPGDDSPLAAAGNLAGLPALAFPVGFAQGQPLSAQLLAAPFGEARLLSAAAWFQGQTRFHLERPEALDAPGASPVAAAP